MKQLTIQEKADLAQAIKQAIWDALDAGVEPEEIREFVELGLIFG